MRKHLSILALSTILITPAFGDDFFISTAGNDANTCRMPSQACRTSVRVVSLMAPGMHSVSYGPGTFPEFNVFHGRQVFVTGAGWNASTQHCDNPYATVVNNVWIQDNATSWVNCLTTTQIACRQFSIGDVSDVAFFASGGNIVANEMCKINTANNLYILSTNGVGSFAVATDNSTVFLYSNIVITASGLGFSQFLTAVNGGVVDASLATFAGPAMTGLRFNLDRGDLTLPTMGGAAVIPGSGSFATNFSVVR